MVAPALKIMVFNVFTVVSPLFSGVMRLRVHPALHLE
jgi:hypothetical protein